MGEPVPGEKEPRKVYVGIAESRGDEPPTLNEALHSAAGKLIEEKLIDSKTTRWFTIAFIEVELGNQHPRTFKVGVTPQEPPGGGGL